MFRSFRLTALAAALVFFAGCDAANEVGPDTALGESGATRAAEAATMAPVADEVIPGQYIVVLSEQPAAQARAAADALTSLTADLPADAVSHTYEAALTGFAAKLTADEAAALEADPRVAYVEPDRMAYTTGSGSQSGATWGIDRIDARSGRDGSYSWDASGEGVTAYVIDSGIRISHSQFGGRASYGRDLYDNDDIASDCTGHGTHVAGTVGGSTYGVAKDVDLVAVRVFGCGPSAPFSVIIAGVNWTISNATLPAVANMSLGGGGYSPLDSAVRNLINAGVQVSISAGNGYGRNACNNSPARVGEAITVGSTTTSDRRAAHSNVGSCIDLFAPGENITSAWYTGDFAAAISTGTSMAAPHVAGVAALYLEDNPNASPQEVRDAIFDASTKNAVTSSNSANNHLLYSRDLGGGTTPPDEFTLDATGEVLSDGRWRATFTWSGANGSQVDILRDGVFGARTSNDGNQVFVVNPFGSGTVVVKVCEEGSTTTCSNEVTLNF